MNFQWKHRKYLRMTMFLKMSSANMSSILLRCPCVASQLCRPYHAMMQSGQPWWWRWLLTWPQITSMLASTPLVAAVQWHYIGHSWYTQAGLLPSQWLQMSWWQTGTKPSCWLNHNDIGLWIIFCDTHITAINSPRPNDVYICVRTTYQHCFR